MSPKSEPFLGTLSDAARSGGSASLTTILVAFAANLLVAVAKSVAAVVTGSASILAEAARNAGLSLHVQPAAGASSCAADRAESTMSGSRLSSSAESGSSTSVGPPAHDGLLEPGHAPPHFLPEGARTSLVGSKPVSERIRTDRDQLPVVLGATG